MRWQTDQHCLILVPTAFLRAVRRRALAKSHPRPQAQARAALTVAMVQAVEQLIVIGFFALKECCGWEGNAG